MKLEEITDLIVAIASDHLYRAASYSVRASRAVNSDGVTWRAEIVTERTPGGPERVRLAASASTRSAAIKALCVATIARAMGGGSR